MLDAQNTAERTARKFVKNRNLKTRGLEEIEVENVPNANVPSRQKR